MALHLEREVEKLRSLFTKLGALVEESVITAIRAVDSRSAEMANQVIAGDAVIDRMEIEVEEECLKILALHQPVATDLRYIISMLKINSDMERIGDLAANISMRVLELSKLPALAVPFDFETMVDLVRSMLKNSLDSLLSWKIEKAYQVLHTGPKVDVISKEVYEYVKYHASTEPATVDVQLQYLSICRYLEKIGDHAENIAEDVVYIMEGEIVRHRKGLFKVKS